MKVVTQSTHFVGRDVINKNTSDLAVRCSTGSVELSCVAINTPLGSAIDSRCRLDKLQNVSQSVGVSSLETVCLTTVF